MKKHKVASPLDPPGSNNNCWLLCYRVDHN